jgi:hypothetical protein
MKVTQLLHKVLSKPNKSKFGNRPKSPKNALSLRENKVVLETIKRHWSMLSEIEADIVVVFCDVLRYLVVAMILYWLYSSLGE